MDKLIKHLDEQGVDADDLLVMSLDAEALYPSLQIQDVAKMCAERVANSNLEFQGVNWKWAAIYAALAFPELEILRQGLADVVPRRKAKSGGEPTVLTVTTDDKKCRWKFHKAPETYNEEEKRRVMAKVIEGMILGTFNNHVYKWETKIFRQLQGGPIGLRATGSVARMVMDQWMNHLKQTLEDNGMTTELLKKYVDDVLAIVWKVNIGNRWNISVIRSIWP